jgi:ubiquinone/menaquinone biosynthesis C-methylase UbiE
MSSLKKSKKVMVDYYNELYNKEKSFREVWEGKIGIKYKVPKEISFFIKFFKKFRNPSVLELGTGDGTSYLETRKHMNFSKYILTDISKSAVEKLRKKGFKAEQIDAENIKFPDNSFDIVCSYNTMHHVSYPKKMADDMLRVAKRFVFLSEANALCIPRKLLERTKRNRKANEKSYTPKRYSSFFTKKNKDKIKNITIIPFCFAFAFTPDVFLKPAIILSELFEKIPILRWQGSSLAILVEKKQNKALKK